MFKVLIFRLKVFFTKMFKGEYSIDYVDLYKNNQVRSPFNPCIKDEFLFHILFFFKRVKNTKTFKTSENIQFGNTSFSLKYDDIFKLRGIPMCFNALRINNFEIKIIGYQDVINDTKFKSIYFFVNNSFILGEYSFTENSKDESLNVSKIVINKYINESIDQLDEFYIEDMNNNCIYFKDNGFERSVKYFNYIDKDSKKIYNELKNHFIPKNTNDVEIESKLNELF